MSRRIYKDFITGEPFKGRDDEEAKRHEYHCHVNTIAVGRRTLYSCNCSERDAYKKRFTDSKGTI